MFIRNHKNQTIGQGFTKLLWDNHNQLQRKDWINVIDAFVRTYNSTIHSAHSCIPHQALFGWKMRGVYDTPDTTIHNDDNDVDNTLNRYRSKETRILITQIKPNDHRIYLSSKINCNNVCSEYI